MKNSFEIIFDDIKHELSRKSVKKWGDQFDKNNTINDWVTFICMYASDAAKLEYSSPKSKALDPKDSRLYLIKAAGLCISAIHNLDKNGKWLKRHYDK